MTVLPKLGVPDRLPASREIVAALARVRLPALVNGPADSVRVPAIDGMGAIREIPAPMTFTFVGLFAVGQYEPGSTVKGELVGLKLRVALAPLP